MNNIAHEIYTMIYIVFYYVHEGCVYKSSLDQPCKILHWSSSSYSNKSLAMNMCFIMGMHVHHHHHHHHHWHHHHLIIIPTIPFFVQIYFFICATLNACTPPPPSYNLNNNTTFNTKLFSSFCHIEWKRRAFLPTPTFFAPSPLGLTSRTILW